jgi:hypothetical protein
MIRSAALDVVDALPGAGLVVHALSISEREANHPQQYERHCAPVLTVLYDILRDVVAV